MAIQTNVTRRGDTDWLAVPESSKLPRAASNNQITSGPTSEWEEMDSARSSLDRSMLPALLEALRNPGLPGFGEEEAMITLGRTRETLTEVFALNETVKTQELRPLSQATEADYRMILDAITSFTESRENAEARQALIAAIQKHLE